MAWGRPRSGTTGGPPPAPTSVRPSWTRTRSRSLPGARSPRPRLPTASSTKPLEGLAVLPRSRLARRAPNAPPPFGRPPAAGPAPAIARLKACRSQFSARAAAAVLHSRPCSPVSSQSLAQPVLSLGRPVGRSIGPGFATARTVARRRGSRPSEASLSMWSAGMASQPGWPPGRRLKAARQRAWAG